MTTVLDTNVLIAAVLEQHPHHAASAAELQRAESEPGRYAVSAHSLAEFFSALTGAKSLRVDPQTAVRLLEENVLDRCRVIALGESGYLSLLRTLAGARLADGIVYDGLIAQAAANARADELVTFDLKHFTKLACIFHGTIRTPQQTLAGQ